MRAGLDSDMGLGKILGERRNLLEAVAKAGIELIVLDRPNPVTGSFVQGPIPDAGRESYVNYFPVPVRHGMTMGELAKMFNAERNINAKLTVVPMEGWQRGDWFDSTGLAWVNPSPNLRSLTEATLYPGVALVEGTNVSVGRGTDTPFELLGAPWIKATELAQYLNGRSISGVRFVPVSFTPNASVHAGPGGRAGASRCPCAAQGGRADLRMARADAARQLRTGFPRPPVREGPAHRPRRPDGH